MIAPRTFRALALLLACACAAALAGCSPKPQGDKKDNKKADPAAPGDDKKGAPPAPDVPTPEPKNALGAAEKAATDTATAFLRDLGNGAAKTDALSASFLKAIGKPVELPSDKEKGFSADNAGTWLKRAGDALTIGLPIKQDQVGDSVFIRGALSGPRFGADPTKTGSYCLRLVKVGGAWKVDLLTVSSADTGTVAAPQTPEGVAQAFALAAFVELTADATGLARDERGLALGALLTPDLRAKLAAPFDSDKAAGLDFNRGALVSAAVKIGGGTSAFTATRAADGQSFAVELTKPTGKKALSVKLAKGTGANEWLVSEVTETAAKG
jgi:hypothetical protein